jgi:hypothetical protein
MLEVIGIILWMIYINKMCQTAGFRAVRYNISIFSLWVFLTMTGKTIGYLFFADTSIGADLSSLMGFLLTIIISYTVIFTDIRTRLKERNNLMKI